MMTKEELGHLKFIDRSGDSTEICFCHRTAFNGKNSIILSIECTRRPAPLLAKCTDCGTEITLADAADEEQCLDCWENEFTKKMGA